MSDSLQPYGLQPARLLCPQDSPGKNTGVRCPALLQGIFPTQGSKLSLVSPTLQAGSLPTKPLGQLRTMQGPWKRSSAPPQSSTCVCPLPRSPSCRPPSLQAGPPAITWEACPPPSAQPLALPSHMPCHLPARQSSLHTLLSSRITPPETGKQTLHLLIHLVFCICYLLMLDCTGSSLLCMGFL